MSSSQHGQSTSPEHIDVLIDGSPTIIDSKTQDILSQTPPPIPPRKSKKREASTNDPSAAGQKNVSTRPLLPSRKPKNKNAISTEKSIDIDPSSNIGNNNVENLQNSQASEAGLFEKIEMDSLPPPLPPRNPTKRNKDFTKYYNGNIGSDLKGLPSLPLDDNSQSKVPMAFKRFDTWVETRHPLMRQYKKAVYVGLILLLIAIVITIICVIIGKSSGGGADVGKPGLPLSGSGDGTYYDPGIGTGACGVLNTGDQLVAALNAPQFGTYANPANSPVCGACIRVTGPKGTVKVKIMDKCPVCKSGDVDMSPAAFDQIADEAQGRVHITWTGC